MATAASAGTPNTTRPIGSSSATVYPCLTPIDRLTAAATSQAGMMTDLALEPVNRDGDEVEWLIVTVHLERLNHNGNSIKERLDLVPYATNPGGTWWITHADPQSPQPAEFEMPPHVRGLALP